jgi:hypothetical protein
MTSVLKKSVALACAPERAFELFTRHAGEWWPAERRHTKDPTSAITILETGRFYERSSAGQEVELGRVRVWDPPWRLVLDWYPGTDSDHPTEVTVTFEPVGPGTRMTLEHRPTASSEDLWNQRAPRYDASWELVLAALSARAAS